MNALPSPRPRIEGTIDESTKFVGAVARAFAHSEIRRVFRGSCSVVKFPSVASLHGNLHDALKRTYSANGSWTISGSLSASSQWSKRSKLAELVAVQPAVPVRSRFQIWKKMQEPNPGICDQLCSSITPNLYRLPTASIDSEVDQSRYLTPAPETMRL